MNQDEKLNLIKDILLVDEREFAEKIQNKIEALENALNSQQQLSKKVLPIISKELKVYTENIPNNLGPVITDTLKAEIKKSKKNVVEILYPIMGQMVKRYVQNEIRLLNEKINERVERVNTFLSRKTIKRKLKSIFWGIKESELILQEKLKPVIEEVLVIEKSSGIIISEYSKTENIDKDMVAGMLTAIKSFAEDAFKKGTQNLQSIEYDLFHIHLQNFSSFYIAVVISGNYNLEFKLRLEDKLLYFARKVINKTDVKDNTVFTNKLAAFFNEQNF